MLRAWTDFFDGSPTDERANSKTRIEVTSGSVHVFASSFENTEKPSGEGGAVSFSSSSDSSILFVEASSFFHCKSSSHGGGIFFFDKGNSILSKVCSSDCFSTGGYGQFCYNYVTNKAGYRNEVNHSTVFNTASSKDYMMYIRFGKVEISRTNESFNRCSDCSSFRIESSGVSGLQGIVSYSTFYNNTSTSRPLLFGSCNNRISYKMPYSNTIKNSQTSSLYGLIDTWEETTIENSCILYNSGYPIICSSNGRITTLKNCSVDFGSSKSGSVSITNSPAKSFTNVLVHLSAVKCPTFYEETKAKKARYKICFRIRGNQRKQGNVIYLPEICFFLVNFIQTNQRIFRITETNNSNIIT